MPAGDAGMMASDAGMMAELGQRGAVGDSAVANVLVVSVANPSPSPGDTLTTVVFPSRDLSTCTVTPIAVTIVVSNGPASAENEFAFDQKAPGPSFESAKP
jgi:hypothetical protein